MNIELSVDGLVRPVWYCDIGVAADSNVAFLMYCAYHAF